MKNVLILCAGIAGLASTSLGAVVLNEPFSYGVGALTTVSAQPLVNPLGSELLIGPWTLHSGTALQLDVSAAGKVNVTTSESEDASTPIAPSGFAFTLGTVTATFEVNFTALPTVAGAYFAHFKDSGTSNFRSRLFAMTTGAATGSFRLAIADTTSVTASAPVDLNLNTTYFITLSIVPSTGRSSFSVSDGTTVTGPITATDATTPLNASTFALRQAAGEGTLTFDTLVVDASAPATAVPEPSAAVMVLSGMGVLGLVRRRRSTWNSPRA